jgi:hypothetical protein
MYTIQKLVSGNVVLNAGSAYALNLVREFTSVPDYIYKTNLSSIVRFVKTGKIKVRSGLPNKDNVQPQFNDFAKLDHIEPILKKENDSTLSGDEDIEITKLTLPNVTPEIIKVKKIAAKKKPGRKPGRKSNIKNASLNK